MTHGSPAEHQTPPAREMLNISQAGVRVIRHWQDDRRSDLKLLAHSIQDAWQMGSRAREWGKVVSNRCPATALRQLFHGKSPRHNVSDFLCPGHSPVLNAVKGDQQF